MRIYNLEHGQAVKCGDTYLIALKNGTYRFGGINVQELTGGRYNEPSEYSFNNLPTIEKVVRNSPIVYYKNADQTLTHEQYSTQRNTINGDYYNEDGYYDFPDLDTEYHVKKELQTFIETWERVEEPQPDTYEEIKLEVVGEVIDTGSKFIQTPLQFGFTKFNNGGFFKVYLSDIAKDEWGKMVIKYGETYKMENSEHSNIRYARFDGKYIYDDTIRGIRESHYHVVNTLDEAKKAEATMRRLVREPIIRHLNKNKEITIDKASVVLRKLNTLKSHLLKVEPKVKTQHDYSSSLKVMKELIVELEGYLSEE